MAARRPTASERATLASAGITRDPLEHMIREYGANVARIRDLERELIDLRNRNARLESFAPVLQVVRASLSAPIHMRGCIPAAFMASASNAAAGFSGLAIGPEDKEPVRQQLHVPPPRFDPIPASSSSAVSQEERQAKRKRIELTEEEKKKRAEKNKKKREKALAKKKEKDPAPKMADVQMPLVAEESVVVSVESLPDL